MMRTLGLTALVACCLDAGAAAPAAPPPPTQSASPVTSAAGNPDKAAPTGVAPQWLDVKPTPYGPLMIQSGPLPPYRDYQMSRVLPPEEKQRWLTLAMPLTARLMQLDAREAMNLFAVKMPARPGVSFDEVVQSMMVRANQINLKQVGSNQLWKAFRDVLNDETAPRIEVFSFCDIAVARNLLRIVPEMIVFLPCRIAVMEDADRNVWVLTLDWDMTWLDLAGLSSGITPELRASALAVREKIESVMRAGANGDL